MQTRSFVVGMAAALGIASLAVGATPAGHALADGVTLQPTQALSYTLGSKLAVGYFVEQAGACGLTLMIAEVVDPEARTPSSAARVRVAIMPGQVADVSSDEGQSIAITCGAGARTIAVAHSRAVASAF